MGYYTEHFVSIHEGDESKLDEIIEALIERTGYTRDNLIDGESCTWYSEEIDMIEISKRYPELVLLVEGTGEGERDMWRHYYKNGQAQFEEAIISFGPYDPSKMKSPTKLES